MNVLDLFSNIGGHAIGLQDAGGFRIVQFVEMMTLDKEMRDIEVKLIAIEGARRGYKG